MTRAEAERAIRASIPPDRARTAIASIADAAMAAGETISVDRRPFVVPRALWLGFIDLEPGRNWGHACLYVLCNVADAAIETRTARFPPEPGPRRLATLTIGADVPTWAHPRD